MLNSGGNVQKYQADFCQMKELSIKGKKYVTFVNSEQYLSMSNFEHQEVLRFLISFKDCVSPVELY